MRTRASELRQIQVEPTQDLAQELTTNKNAEESSRNLTMRAEKSLTTMLELGTKKMAIAVEVAFYELPVAVCHAVRASSPSMTETSEFKSPLIPLIAPRIVFRTKVSVSVSFVKSNPVLN